MKMRKNLHLITLLVMMMMFFVPMKGWTQPKPGTHAPIITHSFAVEKGYNGYIWKIYIEAEDPNGDMFRIASAVAQWGHSSYPTDWIFLKPQYQKHFKGYIQWNTLSGAYLQEWAHITLNISIFDKAGNESNQVIFPFTFETGVKDPYNYKLPTPFDQGDLPRVGYIDINLYNEYSAASVEYRVP